MDKRLDRVQKFDARSLNFPAAAGMKALPLRSYTWQCDIYNNQYGEGACTGFAWSHELAARPKIYPTDNDFALRIYHRAQQIDEWPGEDYSGSSVLAAVKAVLELATIQGKPLYGGYRWAFGTQEVLKVIGYRGPVVLGINWYEGMYDPDEFGFINLDGDIAGGHAIMANGVRIVKLDSSQKATYGNLDRDHSYVRLHNSWGTGYGQDGDAFITVRDLDTLLHDNGEACIPFIRRK